MKCMSSYQASTTMLLSMLIWIHELGITRLVQEGLLLDYFGSPTKQGSVFYECKQKASYAKCFLIFPNIF